MCHVCAAQTKIERMGHLLGDDTTVGTDNLGLIGGASAPGAKVVPGAGVADVVLAAGGEGSIDDSFGLEVAKVEKEEEDVPPSS